MFKIKKWQINEVIDSNGNIIGQKDAPETGSNKETEANRTTDYNAKVSAQNYKNDFLGRFGFYFYENDNEEKPEVVEKIANVMYDKFVETLNYYKENPNQLEVDFEKHNESSERKLDDNDFAWADKVMNVIKPYLEDAFEESNKNLSEANVIEDKIVKKDKKPSSLKKKKDETELSKVEKIADLLSKMPKDDKNKLVDLLEKQK